MVAKNFKMKLFKISNGLVIEKAGHFYLFENEDWDNFVNDDQLLTKMKRLVSTSQPIDQGSSWLEEKIEAPIQSQELWASGVTYMRSKEGRQQESEASGGAQFYAKVYDADRPELFFKATAHRIVGHGQAVRIREDSTWNVPEPELTLVITASGKIVGYTIGNDMSSRSIEGENPLYLPQAKTYDGCASIGPGILVTEQPLPKDTEIQLEINRDNQLVHGSQISIRQMKRKIEDLVAYLYRECTFPFGSLLMTGTGIVPPNDFSLQSGDEIIITIPPIGGLKNTVA